MIVGSIHRLLTNVRARTSPAICCSLKPGWNSPLQVLPPHYGFGKSFVHTQSCRLAPMSSESAPTAGLEGASNLYVFRRPQDGPGTPANCPTPCCGVERTHRPAIGGGEVIAIAGRRPKADRFTVRDRCDIAAWQANLASGSRVVVHELSASEAESSSEFLLAYKPGWQWASWGMARQNGRLMVWSCAAGADLGPFPGVAAALCAVLSDTRSSR
jgi:hypothetical protein